MNDAGIVLALGAGGARGVAHAAVLRRLRAEGIRFEGIVGCSVGAIVGAMFAAVGLEPEEMIEAARRIGPGGLLRFAASRWAIPGFPRRAGDGGAIPGYLARLETASFERLRAGVAHLGVVVYDLRARRERLLCGGPGLPAPIPLAAAVKASAAVPFLFPPLRAEIGGRRRWLSDAGWFAAVPVEHAFAPPLRARRVIAVDLGLLVCLRQARRAYWDQLEDACGDSLVVLRPRVRGTGTVVPRPGQVDRLAAAGEEALDGPALARIRAWMAAPPPAPR